VQQILLLLVSPYEVFFDQVLDPLFYLGGLRFEHVESCENVTKKRRYVNALTSLHNSYNTSVDCQVTVLGDFFLLKNFLKQWNRQGQAHIVGLEFSVQSYLVTSIFS